LKHIHTIEPCIYANRGTCKFGNVKCWFVHKESESNIEREKDEEEIKNNKEVFDKLFVMMENMTERIINVKNISSTKKSEHLR
jgi:hypothetical protein